MGKKSTVNYVWKQGSTDNKREIFELLQGYLINQLKKKTAEILFGYLPVHFQFSGRTLFTNHQDIVIILKGLILIADIERSKM